MSEKLPRGEKILRFVRPEAADVGPRRQRDCSGLT